MAGSHEVRGSIPLCSTNYFKARQTAGLFRVPRRFAGAPTWQYGVVAVRQRTCAAGLMGRKGSRMTRMKVAVSACLLGVPCRFDGRSKPSAAVQDFIERYSCQVVRICPEVMGGLSIPHPPHEQKLVGGQVRVVDSQGNDHTGMFLEGSRKACQTACAAGCTHAILKAKSPSCGVGEVYDGTFTDALVAGNGTAAQMMLDAGMKLATEKDIERAMRYANTTSSSAEAFFR